MKDKCAMARDLMPLCIDGAASEESRGWVQEHTAQCRECAEIFDEMKAELPQVKAREAEVELEKAALVFRRRRRRRLMVLLLTGIMIGVLLMGGWIWLDNSLSLHISPIPLEAYAATVLRSRSGEGLIIFDLDDRELAWSVSSRIVEAPGGCRLEIVLNTTPIRTTIQQDKQYYRSIHTPLIGRWQEDGWYVPFGRDISCLMEVRLVCGEAWATIYTHGDEVPFCSQALDDYMKPFRNGSNDVPLQDYLRDLLERRDAVPEWKD